MKRTALILAGAVAFDLGVMVVAAQAQQQGDIPPTRPTHGSPMSGPIYGLVVQDPTGTGGCTPGSPLSSGTANPCAPAAITDQAAQGNLTAVMPTAGGKGRRDTRRTTTSTSSWTGSTRSRPVGPGRARWSATRARSSAVCPPPFRPRAIPDRAPARRATDPVRFA